MLPFRLVPKSYMFNEIHHFLQNVSQFQQEDQNIDYRNIQPSADYFASPRGENMNLLIFQPIAL